VGLVPFSLSGGPFRAENRSWWLRFVVVAWWRGDGRLLTSYLLDPFEVVG
jgi:hypothetical protein